VGKVGECEFVASKVEVLREASLVNVQNYVKLFLVAVVVDPLFIEFWIKSKFEDEVRAWWVEAVLLCLEPLLDGCTFKCSCA
jgi:hypothetical protein